MAEPLTEAGRALLDQVTAYMAHEPAGNGVRTLVGWRYADRLGRLIEANILAIEQEAAARAAARGLDVELTCAVCGDYVVGALPVHGACLVEDARRG